MRADQIAPTSIDDYIAAFPDDVQRILERIRSTIRQAVPDAEETISYRIPAFTLQGHYFIYFAAFKNHVGLYPAPVGRAEFEDELSAYASGKGTARFPFTQPVPFDLISRIVKFRAKEALERAPAKRRKE